MKMVTVALLAVMAGCAASSSSDSTSSSSDTNSAIQGNVTLSGVVTVSDSAQKQVSDTLESSSARVLRLQELSLQARHATALQLLESTGGSVINSVDDEVPMEGGKVYVSYLNDTGEVVSTDISVEISATGSYQIDNLKDGVTYILTAEKVGFDSDGNINKIKTEAISHIESGATTAAANVQPGTDIIMRAIISAIQDTVDSLVSSDSTIDDKTKAIINTLVQNIITVVTETVSKSIESGETTVEVSVETVKTKEELATLSDSEKDAEREKIVTNTKKVEVDTTLSDTDKKVKSQLETDSSVTEVVKEASAKAQAAKDVSKMSIDEAKLLIARVFGVTDTGSSDSNSGSGRTAEKNGPEVPDFFITQFANAYLGKKQATLTTFAQAWKDAKGDHELRTVEELKADFAEIISDQLTVLYNYYDTSSTANLSTVVNLQGAKIAFPSDKKLTLPITGSTSFNVPQMISVFWMTGLFDETEGEGEGEGGGGDNMDPYTLLKGLGILNLDANKIYIIDAGVRPVRFYVPDDLDNQTSGTWSQTDALNGDVSIFADGDVSESTIKKVVLRYTKTDGSAGVVELEKQTNEGQNNGGEGSEIQNSVAAMSRINANKVSAHNITIAEAGNGGNQNRLDLHYRLDPWRAIQNKERAKIVSDYKSGDAVIQVIGQNDQVLATTTVKIYKIEMNAPEWVFPVGPNMVKIKQQGWDPAFEPQLIALPDNVSALTKVRFEWKPSTPATPLPDGLRVAYAVFVGLQVHKKDWNNTLGDTSSLGTEWDWQDDNGNKWRHIWDSWQNGSLIFSNYVTLPSTVSFNATTSSSEQNFEASYEVSIRPVVVDKRGFVVWEGDESRSNFKVGQDINWVTTVKGTVVFPNQIDNIMPQIKNYQGTWKIGLFYNNKMIERNGKTKLRPVFYDQDEEGPRGAVRTRSGVPLIASLGTTAEIKTDPSREYTLPGFSKTDEILKLNEDMMIKVWLDVSTKPSNDFRWNAITPSANAIDFASTDFGTYPVEENTDMEFGNIRRGQEGIVRWRQSGPQFLSDGGEVEINGKVFNWNQAQFEDVPEETVPTNKVKKESDASNFEDENVQIQVGN